MDLINGSICGTDGILLDKNNIGTITDPYGAKIDFKKGIIVDNNGFVLTKELGEFKIVNLDDTANRQKYFKNNKRVSTKSEKTGVNADAPRPELTLN